MSKLKLIHRESRANQAIELEEHEFTFDPICPKVVHLHEGMRETLATSALIRDHRFVFLVGRKRDERKTEEMID